MQLDLQTVLDRIGWGRFQQEALVLTGLVLAADGAELMLIPFLTSAISCNDWNIGTVQKTYISISLFLGMYTGSNISGYISDRFGRRNGTLFASICVTVFGTASIFSPSYAILCLNRFGVGIGVGSSPAPFALLSELLPASTRGWYLTMQSVLFTFGSLYIVCMTIFTSSWQGLLFFAVVPAYITLILNYNFLTESPRYCLVIGDNLRARKILQTAIEKNKSTFCIDDVIISPPTKVGQKENDNDNDNDSDKVGVSDLFSHSLRFITLSLCSLFFLMSILYYCLTILTVTIVHGEEGNQCETTISQYFDIALSNAAEFLGFFAISFLLDWIGRKKTIALMFTICGCSLVLLWSDRLFVTPLLCLIRASALAFNQGIWTFTSELFPTTHRTIGIGFAASFARIGSIFGLFLAYVLFAHSPSLTLALCCFICLTAIIIVLRIPYETNQQQLTDK